ncbi:heme peroxidase [Lactarius quietus]|nr:heme peroxidase [Lactarius quietus]
MVRLDVANSLSQGAIFLPSPPSRLLLLNHPHPTSLFSSSSTNLPSISSSLLGLDADMRSRFPSRFYSRASVGDIASSAYDLLTAAGQIINTIKPASANSIKSVSARAIKAAFSTQPYDETAVRAFQNAFNKSLASYDEPSAFVTAAGIDAFKNINSLDDRKMGLEHVVHFLSEHADGALKDRVTEFENKLVQILYDDLSHPPATYIGPEYQYRRVDGSHNNISESDMGKAGMPYARSVQQTHPIPLNTLPEAGLVFDTLLQRQKFIRHPAGLSSMMFSFAALVIHTVFRTSMENVNINDTSSYVDLAPLYGNNEERLNKIRVRDGRGLMLPDTFAEDRLLLLPPAVSALLVFPELSCSVYRHKLLEINKRQTYKKPEDIPFDDSERAKKIYDQDEDIFQTARLINCAWFGAAIFSDYFSSILGLVRQGSTWSLNPFGEIRDLDHKLFERGRGNVCSVEFNCLYRWHATTSQANERWVTQLMGSIFKDKPIDKLTFNDFKDAVKKLQVQEPDISHWTFGNLKRGPDGKFNDTNSQLSLRTRAVEHPAAAFGARGTPHVMRLHEIMGIESNRRWGVCSLNEFLSPSWQFLGLKPYASFLEWNSDKEIAEAAERLYSNIDNLELYVGLQAEESKKLVEGAGLCPGYTISRAILSDAIALTRGDRFLTADSTPFNLTAWGFADCQRDPKGPGNGSMLGRLLLRGLPREFSDNSVYTWFPLQTPESMEVFLRKLGTILRSAQFRHPYGDKGARIVSGEGFFLASNKEAESQRDQREVLRVLGAPDETDHIAHYFYEKTRELINVKSYLLADKSIKFVDIVRDVLRYVPLHWAATDLAGLTLKADNETLGESGDYTESQLYGMITDVYSFLFLDLDPSKSMNIEASAKEHIKTLQGRIKANILADVGSKHSVAGLVGNIPSLFSAKARKQKLTVAESLFQNGASADCTTNNVLSLLIGASVELSQSIINVVDYYLDKPDVVKQLKAADPKNPASEGYIYEAMRKAILTAVIANFYWKSRCGHDGVITRYENNNPL